MPEFDIVIAIVGLMIAANVPTYAILLHTLKRVDTIAANCRYCKTADETESRIAALELIANTAPAIPSIEQDYDEQDYEEILIRENDTDD